MKGVIALALLVGGVCIAATSGSLLGNAEGERSQWTAQAAIAGGIVGELKACDEEAEAAREQADGDSPADLARIDEAQLACRVGAARVWDAELAESDLTNGQLAVDKPLELAAVIATVQELKSEADQALEETVMLAPGPRFMQWFSKGGIGWLVGLLLVVAGAVLGRRAAYERATAPSTGATATPTFDEAVATLLAATAKMQPLVAATADGDDCPAARTIIEDMEVNVLAPVVDERDRYKARDGIAVFAEYFGPFSAGERNLARAWSSLTDGYPHVAADALVAATTAFEQAAAAYAKRSV